MNGEFDAVIGLEVHCQLATGSKIFCSCPAKPPTGISVSDVEVNASVCPVCAGHPGTLPVLNQKVIEFAAKAGLATGCTINLESYFARKNYFYPDLPKGYQITQFDKPLCENGFLEIEAGKRVHIQRIHIEEDAGKSVHMSGYSLVNLNRAGVPLIEIVSGPDMNSPAEAGTYLRALYGIVTALGICDGNLQEGNFRCDANVSVKPKGSKLLGTRTEIKNVNSFRFVEKAIEGEILRQIDLIESGKKVIQETRLYDSVKNRTQTMRTKEEADDYRYFPDPDILPVVVERAWVQNLRDHLPELPRQKSARWVATYGISEHDAALLSQSPFLYGIFEAAAKILATQGKNQSAYGKPLANLLIGEVLRLSNESESDSIVLRPEHLAEVVELLLSDKISSTGAKRLLVLAWESGEAISALVEREGLLQESNEDALLPVVKRVVDAHPAQAAELRAGKDKLLGFFVGQIMKESGGKANPALLQKLIRKQVGSS